MLKFLNLQPEIFGVDINDLSLRLVKLEKKRGLISLASFNQIKIRPGIVKEGVIQKIYQKIQINIRPGLKWSWKSFSNSQKYENR